jgi:hypothetical protein
MNNLSSDSIKKLIKDEIEAAVRIIKSDTEKSRQENVKRIFQNDIVPNVVKQRHIDGTIIKRDVFTNRPVDGGAVNVTGFFATDTGAFYLWDGMQWVTI